MNVYATLRAALIGLVLGVPPPAVSVANEAPWDESPAPFLFSGDPLRVDQDRAVSRSIEIKSPAGLDVGEGHTLRLNGPVHSHGPAVAGLYKLGAGHMVLSGPNTTPIGVTRCCCKAACFSPIARPWAGTTTPSMPISVPAWSMATASR